MEKLSVVTVLEKNRLASDSPFLMLLMVEIVDFETNIPTGEYLYLVKNNEPIMYLGHEFTPCEFEVDLRSEVNAAPSITLTIVDYTRVVHNRLDALGGGVGSNATVTILNKEAIDENRVEVVQTYKVVSASAAAYIITWTLGAEDALSITFPKRKMIRDRCGWRYKDAATCGYTGDKPLCDLTLNGPNGCDKHVDSNGVGNQLRFGGFSSLSYT